MQTIFWQMELVLLALIEIVENKALKIMQPPIHRQRWREFAFVLREPPYVFDIYILYSEGLVHRDGW